MRWVTYRSPADGAPRPGLVQEGAVHGLPPTETLLGLIESDGGLPAAAQRVAAEPAEVVDLADVALCAPIPRPPSVRDFLSFEEHLRNAVHALGRSEPPPVWYEQPAFYFSNPAAILGPDSEVPISPGCASFDYEVEVAAIVGRAGSDLTPAEAETCIAGYTIFCDWSARDVQAKESTIGLGPAKGKDGATSIGPALVTPDELEPYRSGKGFQLAMRATVNGRDLGGGNWADIHWSFGQMLAYASRGTQLRPGDVIGSGTVGTGCLLELSSLHGSQRYPWLQPDDEVTISVELLGDLTGRIVAGPDPVPLS
jgi:2-keto-4-pentenoate hydratase/2-oxohepta-3-ene-1,7-dioic acid hydratase in catechol pathway